MLQSDFTHKGVPPILSHWGSEEKPIIIIVCITETPETLIIKSELDSALSDGGGGEYQPLKGVFSLMIRILWK